ncbi:MAG: cold shock domain-containing protein [Candidatus Doudnabacteria bacterium]|nr:cold shock domain-containing protein [Candidatus Doudnabacteria bacterium]
MKKGKIIRLGTDHSGSFKGFAFVRADDDRTETFVHRSAYPHGMQIMEGDVIEYEIEDTDKGPRAKDVKVLERGSSPPPIPKASPPGPASPTVTAGSQEIEVLWEKVGPPIKQGNSQFLPITLTLKSDKQLPAGIEVTLTANGKGVKDPSPKPSPDGKGQVEFLVPMKNETVYALATDVKVDGKKVKTLTRIWEKRSEKTASTDATPAPSADPKLPEIEVVNPPRDPDLATGMFLVNVVTRKNDVKTNRDFSAFSDISVEIRQKTASGLSAVTSFIPVATGQYQLYISFEGVQTKVVFRLDNGKEAVVRLRK